MPDSGINEVTEPIELSIVEDRLRFTVTSGNSKRTYCISLHKARNAAMATAYLLDERRKRGLPDNVREFPKRG